MQLDRDIYDKMRVIDWLIACGREPSTGLGLPVEWAADLAEAVALALGAQWGDARTEAQGDLTGSLAKHDYDAYSFWNQLSRESRRIIDSQIMPDVEGALHRIDALSLRDGIALDLNRIALHAAYWKREKRLPDFFQHLLLVYQSGRLPCGWIGDLEHWPNGRLVVY